MKRVFFLHSFQDFPANSNPRITIQSVTGSVIGFATEYESFYPKTKQSDRVFHKFQLSINDSCKFGLVVQEDAYGLGLLLFGVLEN